MNQLCKVCGEPAAGFHFGAFTCEGCKSFFGRTYNNISAISGCKNNGDCVINKKNRTACKACRLRKCLLVGMSKSGSRYGRRSNWFKIHCLLQEQQSQQQQQQQQHQQQSQLQQQQQQHSPQSQIQANFEQLTNLHQQFQIRASSTYSQHKLNQQHQQQQQQQQSKTVDIQKQNSLINSFFPVPYLINGGSKNNIENDLINNCTGKTNDYEMKTTNHRISESASDSGASSADPDDSGSNKERTPDSPIINDEKCRNLTPNSDPIRSASEPLRGFPPYPTANEKCTPLIAFPTFHVPTTILQSSISATVNIQDEPIDLSIKSASKRCRTTSPKPNGVEIHKTTPLDLTLVRSTEPMSG